MSHHFIEEQFSTLLLPQVHHLDGDPAARGRVGGGADHARAALADLTKPGESGARVTLAYDEAER